MGYTPAFDTIYTGTLYGKWPMAAVWASLLPLVDSRGEINLSPEAIAGMTGWPLDLLIQGIQALCEPDPRSRSKAEDGRRLVLIDATRDWGWRVVNIGLYRARASGLNQITDGRNAEKVRRYKAKHRETPVDTAGHQKTPENTPDTHSDSDTNTNKEKKAGAEAPLVLHASLPRESWEEWLAHRREKRLSMSPRALKTQLKLLAEYPTAIQREMIDTSINAGWEGLFRPKGKPVAKPNGGSEWV